ncbi:Dihydropteroate synthase-like protein [Haematococcus lacustris]
MVPSEQRHPPPSAAAPPAAAAAAGTPYSGAGAAGDGQVVGGAGGQGAGRGVGGGVQGGGQVLRRVTPVGRSGRLLCWGQRTLVMGILNITPDSFSDGGRLLRGLGEGEGEGGGGEGQLCVAALVENALEMVRQGVDVLDMGGQSTRPGAPLVPEAQELARVLPAIRALRATPGLEQVVVSVDTFNAQVARQAVAAGADMVNDVSGGALDPRMLPQVAELGVPLVLMHMRGDPGSMQQPQHTSYGCVWREVAQELQAAADRAMAAGIPAWNIILDPGVGFAKTAEGSLELIRHLPDMRQVLQGAYRAGPLLVGPSRKGFLGKLTGRQRAEERDAATVAACTACVAHGADVVRVHNVRDNVDAVRVADAVWRCGRGLRPGHCHVDEA